MLEGVAAAIGILASASVCEMPAPEQAREQVLLLNEQYIRAVSQSDRAWFEGHLSDRVLVMLGSGERLSKARFLDALTNPSPFRSLSAAGASARAFGIVVQIDADASWTMHDGREGVSKYIDTYAWLDCRWQVISAQITPVPPGA